MIYPYKCSGCGATQDVWQRLSDYETSPNIPDHCGVKMHRVFTVPMVAPDYQPFVSHVDGTVINSRSAQREHMARHNLQLYDDVASDLPARRAAIQEAADKERVQDMVEAAQMVEAGYKPAPLATAVVKSDQDWSESGIDVIHDLPKKENVQLLEA